MFGYLSSMGSLGGGLTHGDNVLGRMEARPEDPLTCDRLQTSGKIESNRSAIVRPSSMVTILPARRKPLFAVSLHRGSCYILTCCIYSALFCLPILFVVRIPPIGECFFALFLPLRIAALSPDLSDAFPKAPLLNRTASSFMNSRILMHLAYGKK